MQNSDIRCVSSPQWFHQMPVRRTWKWRTRRFSIQVATWYWETTIIFLQMMANGTEPQKVRDYVAWMLDATQCIGVKAVNPGGINAFKFNQRALNVDEPHAHYRVTPGEIVRSLSEALADIKLSHPLHVHASNLGVPGNYRSTIDTINAADGLPLHLAHVQFHSYGSEGKRKFSSASLEISEQVNQNPQISVDVGHIMFGQTITISADTMHQYSNRHHGHPRKSTFMDIECEAGCGVVPFRYRSKQFVNALQWAIGLELFLNIKNPWQVFSDYGSSKRSIVHNLPSPDSSFNGQRLSK